MKKISLLVCLALFLMSFYGCGNGQAETRFSYVSEKVLSSQGKDFFVRVGNSYDSIKMLAEINEKHVARVYNIIGDSQDPKYEMFVIYGDKEFGPYTYVSERVIEFQDGIAFYARDNSDNTVRFDNGFPVHTGEDVKNYIVTDKRETTIPYEIEESSLQQVNGKIAFEIPDLFGWSFFSLPESPTYKIVYDFKELAEEYDASWNLCELDGKLYFEARRGGGESFIIADGKPMDVLLENVHGLSVVGNDISYWGERNGEPAVVINKKILDGIFVGEPKFANGVVYFVTKEADEKEYLYYGDEKFGPYDVVDDRAFNESIGNHVVFEMSNLGADGERIFIDGKIFGPYDTSGTYELDGEELYFLASSAGEIRLKLYRASDGKVIEENLEAVPSIVNGKIISEKWLYEDDSPYPTGSEYYVDGENISKKYEDKYSSIHPGKLGGQVVLFAQEAYEEHGSFFIIIDGEEYGPFPNNDSRMGFNGKMTIEVLDELGKKELYVSLL